MSGMHIYMHVSVYFIFYSPHFVKNLGYFPLSYGAYALKRPFSG